MPAPKRDKAISALETVHSALKPLSPAERQRVLASVYALLEISPRPSPTNQSADGGTADVSSSTAVSQPPTPSRPLAIRELIQDKKPRTHPQFITLFAYFREKYQNRAAFSRDDLKSYYTLARENPPGNYDRDFVEAVKRGWIYEDAENSYITTKGIDAVTSGFSGGAEPRVRLKRPGAKKKSKIGASVKGRR